MAIKRYQSGLRLVVKPITGLMSVAIGVIVGAGAALETDDEDGISHFIEHVTFKGTRSRSEEQISNDFDGIGAQQNAFTSKDITCYYVKTISQHTERAFELLSDLFLNSTYPDEGMDRERGVILEEISMNEDTPEDLCLDLLSEAFYGKENYGRTILGPAKNVRRFDKEDVLAYRKKYYVPANTVISFAGNITEEEAETLVERYFAPMAFAPFAPCVKEKKSIRFASAHLFRPKDIEQVQLSLAYPSLERHHPLADALSVLNCTLGGSMSSRLFQSVREKQGLAYTVYSDLYPYDEVGSLMIYAAVNPRNADKALKAILAVIEELKRTKITQEELLRAKEQIKSGTIFAQESTTSQMILYGKYLMQRDEFFRFDEKIAKVDAVTMEDVEEALALSFDSSRLASAIVGKKDCRIG